MSKTRMSNTEAESRAAMQKHGLAPLENPMGDDHHTDAPFTDADAEIAELAYWLGGLFIDKQDYGPNTPVRDTYWYNEMSSIDCWKRVARALRIHGLKIVNESALAQAAAREAVLVECLKDCADDLEAEIHATYAGVTKYPDEMRRKARDMKVVTEARNALATPLPHAAALLAVVEAARHWKRLHELGAGVSGNDRYAAEDALCAALVALDNHEGDGAGQKEEPRQR